MILAKRPEAMTGKYLFLGAVILVNQTLNYSNTQVRQKIASFNYIPIFKSIQMTCPFRKCLFSLWRDLMNPGTCMQSFSALPNWHRWLGRAKVS